MADKETKKKNGTAAAPKKKAPAKKPAAKKKPAKQAVKKNVPAKSKPAKVKAVKTVPVEEEIEEQPIKKATDFGRFIFSHSTQEGTIAAGGLKAAENDDAAAKAPISPNIVEAQHTVRKQQVPAAAAKQPTKPIILNTQNPISAAVKQMFKQVTDSLPETNVRQPEQQKIKEDSAKIRPFIQHPSTVIPESKTFQSDRPVPVQKPAEEKKIQQTKQQMPAIMRPSEKPKRAVSQNVRPGVIVKRAEDIHKQVQKPSEEHHHKNNNRPAENRNGGQQKQQQAQPQRKPAQPQQEKSAGTSAKKLPEIKISSDIILRDLSERMGVKPIDFIKKLMGLGVFATINQRLDEDTAVLAAAEYGYDLKIVPIFGEEELNEEIAKDDDKDLKPRCPIITIMGHVDHGKTTLLDALRSSNVAGSEVGQITQHIGAYMVRTERGPITVLDTPGHEAFTAMRANGVKVTDIVVLVVSAVDGVMPQTVEAINHAKAANAPIIVAVNKIDLPTANTQQIKQQLSNYGLMPEEWGGKTPMVEISAKKRLNLDKLLEIISIQAELMELKANPDKRGQGIVIEARLDPKKGVVATIINVTGTIRIGDPFTVGSAYGKIRALIDDHGARLTELRPSEPAEVLGISGEVPQAGDILKVTENDKEARLIADKRKMNKRQESFSHQKQVSLLALRDQVENNNLCCLNVVLKTDVFGSLQAIKDSLEKLGNSEVSVQILHSGVGNVTESDVLLAKASNAVIIGFHINADSKVSEAAKLSGVEIRNYDIIYDLIEDVKAAMSGLLAPEIVETVTGRAEIQQIFNLSSGRICGSLAKEGRLTRGQKVRISRAGQTVGNGKISGLKRFKDDVKEVDKGLECGILIDGFKDYRVGDVIEAITTEERTRRLSNV